MVVTSFYNCLIDKEDAIPISTMLEIERIRKKGIIFTVCTNRDYKEVLDYNRDFPFLDYIISYNGSYIFDVKKNKCIFKKRISKKIIEEICKIYPKNKKYFYQTNSSSQDSKNAENIYKIEVEYSKKIDLEPLKKLNVNTTTFTNNKKHYLEIIPKEIDTYNGLKHILLKNKIKNDEVISISANESDLSLIKNIPNNFIVSNADKILKEYAKNKTKSNKAKGLEIVLNRL